MSDAGVAADFADLWAGQLRLPCRWVLDAHGNPKTYTIPPLGLRTGTELRLAVDGAETDPAARRARQKYADMETLSRAVLGTAYAEMLDDDAPDVFVDRATLAAYTDYIHGRVRALRVWAVGADPKAMDWLMDLGRSITAIL